MRVGVIADVDLSQDHRIQREIEIIRKDHQVFTLTLADFSINVSKLRPFIHVCGLFNFIVRNKVRQFIADNHLDILHVHDLYMAKPCSDLDIPMILDLHEDYPEAVKRYPWSKMKWTKPEKWIEKEKEYLDLADGYVLLSDNLKYKLRPHVIFPNVVDIEHFRSIPIVPVSWRPGLSLIYFGKVAERRGIFNVIEWTKGQGINLTIAGPVDKVDRGRFFIAIQGRSDINYLPWIDVRDLPSHLAVHDVGLNPNVICAQHSYGAPRKIYYYLAAGLPILSSHGQNVSKIVEESSGIVYETEKQFKTAIKLFKDPEILRKYKDDALAYRPNVEANFTKLYLEALSSHQRDLWNCENDTLSFTTHTHA